MFIYPINSGGFFGFNNNVETLISFSGTESTNPININNIRALSIGIDGNFSLLRVSRDHLPCGAVVMQSIASTAPYLPPAGQLRLIPIYYAP